MARSKDPSSYPKNGRDVTRAVESHGGTVRNASGSHRIANVNGKTFTFHDHGEYRPGIRAKLNKIMAAAGILLLAAAIATLFPM